LVGGFEVGSETLVEDVDQLGELDLFATRDPGPDRRRSRHFAAFSGLELDRSLADLLQPVVLERHLVVETVGRPLVAPR
jgi:hypothetical protein